MLEGVDTTPDDPAELRAMNRLLADEVKSQALLIEKLKHQLAGHNRHRFGATSESLDQLNLIFAEDEAIATAADKQAAPTAPAEDNKPARQHNRKSLPDHLQRNDQLLLPGDDCNHCGGSLKKPGEDVTEELEYVPGRFVVNRFIRPRKASACCETFAQAPLPPRPIERGRPGPGLLAHVLVSVNHHAIHANATAAHGAHPVISPRKNGKPWKPTSAGANARNEAVNASKDLGSAL